jgi:hypothetical protein
MQSRPIRTLQDFRDTERAIHAYCWDHYFCSHNARLRLELLALHLGWAFDFFAGSGLLAGPLRCSICGWYHPTFALGHAGRRPEFSGSHGAGTMPITTEELIAMQRAREILAADELPWVGKRKSGRKFGR